jgi:hypothetical protein
MKLWILVAVAVLLLIVAMRTELFAATPSIRGPPYDKDEKIRIFGMATPANAAILRQRAEGEIPASSNTAQREIDVKERAGGYIVPAITDFFTQKFTPATVPLTREDVTAFVAARPTSPLSSIEQQILTVYFVDQQGVGTAETSGYAAALAAQGQGVGYLVASNPALSSTGTGPLGASQATGTTGTPTTTGGSTTGLQTTTTSGPSNGLFGPAFTSLGEPAPASGNTPDSSKTTSYPQVLGGRAPPTTTVPGVGVVRGGRSGLGDLPSMESLGATEQSQYFPFSRTPGDMEKIPDPFRVAQTFDVSSLSSKTEPVPFLTDFSAFQK